MNPSCSIFFQYGAQAPLWGSSPTLRSCWTMQRLRPWYSECGLGTFSPGRPRPRAQNLHLTQTSRAWYYSNVRPRNTALGASSKWLTSPLYADSSRLCVPDTKFQPGLSPGPRLPASKTGLWAPLLLRQLLLPRSVISDTDSSLLPLLKP